MKCEFPLFEKNILLCVCASVATYKAIELANAFKKLGSKVCVVMSEEAKKFISPLSFEGITHTRVLHKQTESWVDSSEEKLGLPRSYSHIAYAKWADICLIAPASANTIAKLACGVADNLIVQTLLASNAPKLIAPAMNTQMFKSFQVQNALQILAPHAHIIAPREALLACDTKGIGALAKNEEIIFNTIKTGLKDDFWQNKNIIITGGGSAEKIDSVRCVSNLSSGLQASALAIALYTLGANVTFISSKFPLTLPKDVRIIKVESNQDYENAIIQTLENLKPSPTQNVFLFMAAALADFAPKNQSQAKIKKQGIDVLTLNLEKTKDILASLNQKGLIKIGFKAEDDSISAIKNAKQMLSHAQEGGKGCEIVCLNLLENKPFGSEKNHIQIIDSSGVSDLGLDSKINLAYKIANFIKNKISRI